jgi:DegV family protein with EDD domain
VTVRVVTDSACSLPAELAAAWGVEVVPMWLTIGTAQFRDGELSLAEVVARLGEGISTSGPAPGDLAQVVRQVDEGEGVALLTVSRKMSSVYQAALLAAGLVAEEGKKVAVVDTGTAAGAQGLVVLAASKAARAGLPLADVVAVAERAAASARLVATLPTLDHLARSGRVPGAAAWGARWLGLHSLFEFRGAVVRPLRPVRGRQQALARLVQLWARSAVLGRRNELGLHLTALHALDPATADDLLAQVRQRLAPDEPQTAFSSAFSPVMVAHTGPGLAGLAWWWEEPEKPAAGSANRAKRQ